MSQSVSGFRPSKFCNLPFLNSFMSLISVHKYFSDTDLEGFTASHGDLQSVTQTIGNTQGFAS